MSTTFDENILIKIHEEWIRCNKISIENNTIKEQEKIANAKLENGRLLINGNNEKMTHFWVLTSDYLMNGGDKMSFFEQRTNAIMNGKLLRNAFIEEVKSQDTLIFNEELRIK